jgi:hypothetical protein
MLNKKLSATLALCGVLAVSASGSALADGHYGHGGGGWGPAGVALGVISAVAVGSAIANASAPPVYYGPAPVTYVAPPPVYYSSAPVYYAPQPRVYYSAPVVVRGYERHSWEYRDGRHWH